MADFTAEELNQWSWDYWCNEKEENPNNFILSQIVKNQETTNFLLSEILNTLVVINQNIFIIRS